MLVLTRKAKQSIMIGDDVEVTVLSCDSTKVRLGINAPAEIAVHRTEVYLAVKSEDDRIAGGERNDPLRARRRAG